MPLSQPSLAIVIPNWNGALFIERCLGSVLAAARALPAPPEILITDDASTDASAEIIRRQFPQLRLLAWGENVGFGESVNRAMATTGAELIFLLNNDLAPRGDFLTTLLAARAADPDAGRLFAIGAQTLDWHSGAPNHAGQRAAWRDGMIAQEPFSAEALAPADFFQAGACLIDRRAFLALGGFPAIYHPGYWEDYDLAWQARRRGLHVLYEPRAVAWHLGKGSMRRKLGDHGVSLALRRNHLLFIWANLASPGLLARHALGLPRLVLTDNAQGDEASWGRAVLAALGRLPAVLALRRRRRIASPIPDRELLNLS